MSNKCPNANKEKKKKFCRNSSHIINVIGVVNRMKSCTHNLEFGSDATINIHSKGEKQTNKVFRMIKIYCILICAYQNLS